jgi:hypothetical protein
MSKLTGVDRIAAERVRQIAEKGWTPEHDREHHPDGSLAEAAAVLLLEYIEAPEATYVSDRSPEWVGALAAHVAQKYVGLETTRILEIAGAFIAAELDRREGAS